MKFQHRRRGGAAISLLWIPVLVLTSCVYEKDDCLSEAGHSDTPALVIRVNTVSPYSTTPTASNVVEKIKSLRVIIATDNLIQVNELATFETAMDVSSFTYKIEKEYLQGEKRYYFIANEESIGTPQFPSGTKIPAGVSTASITEMLDSEIFQGVTNYRSPTQEDTRNREALETLLTNLYFAPTYDIITSDPSAQDLWAPKGDIYLPYSVCYAESEITEKTAYEDVEGNIIGLDAQMYLVPVATKFEFHFTSSRTSTVELSDLKVTQFDNLNYLLAKVETGDRMKTLPEQTTPIYWPDWLAVTARKSWENIGSADQNNSFNNTYGWISQYGIPGGSAKTPVVFPPNGTPSVATIPAATQNADKEIVPAKLDLGPFYLPESKNTATVNGASTQWFGINFKLKDTKTKSEFTFESDDSGSPIAIENLGALFRNTHVVINVTMGEGEPMVEGVYAELMPWIRKAAQGFVGDYRK